MQSAQFNMQSAREHSQIIDDYLLEEGTPGHILGPFSPHTMLNICFGVIPKKSHVCLSPEGHSINDAISAELCTLQYISVGQVALAAMQMGQGAN